MADIAQLVASKAKALKGFGRPLVVQDIRDSVSALSGENLTTAQVVNYLNKEWPPGVVTNGIFFADGQQPQTGIFHDGDSGATVYVTYTGDPYGDSFAIRSVDFRNADDAATAGDYYDGQLAAIDRITALVEDDPEALEV